MILVITISLSDGGVVIYELNNSTYTNRSISKDEDGELQDELQIIKDTGNKIFTFNSKVDEYKQSIRHVGKSSSNIDLIYDEFSEEIEINEYRGFKLTRNILKSSNIVSYFIQVNELDQLTKKSDFLKNVAIVRDNYLFVFADFKTDGLNAESIIDVKVEWKNEFSEYVTQKLELLKHSDSKSK